MFALLCFITAGAVCVYSAEPRPAVEGAEKPRGYSDLVQADASALVKILQKPLAFSYFGPNGEVFGVKKKRENSDVRRLSTKRILIPERMRSKKKKRADVVYEDFKDIKDELQTVLHSKTSDLEIEARKSDEFEDSGETILSSKANSEETDDQRKHFSNGSEGENSSIKINKKFVVSNPNRLNYEDTEDQRTSLNNENKDDNNLQKDDIIFLASNRNRHNHKEIEDQKKGLNNGDNNSRESNTNILARNPNRLNYEEIEKQKKQDLIGDNGSLKTATNDLSGKSDRFNNEERKNQLHTNNKHNKNYVSSNPVIFQGIKVGTSKQYLRNPLIRPNNGVFKDDTSDPSESVEKYSSTSEDYNTTPINIVSDINEDYNDSVIDNLQSKPINVMSEEIEYPGDDFEKIQAIKNNYNNGLKRIHKILIVPNTYQNKYDEQNHSDKNEDYNHSVIDNLHTQSINDEIGYPGDDLEKTQAIQNSYKIDLKRISNASNQNQYDSDDHGAVYKLNKVQSELKKAGNEDYSSNDDIEKFSELQKKLDSDFKNDYEDFNNDEQELSNQYQFKKLNTENLNDNNRSSSSLKKNVNDSSNHYDYDDNDQTNDEKLNNTRSNRLQKGNYYDNDDLNNDNDGSKSHKTKNLGLPRKGYSRYDDEYNVNKYLNKNINSSLKKDDLYHDDKKNTDYDDVFKKEDYYDYDEDESKLKDNPIKGDIKFKQLLPIENLRYVDHNENIKPVYDENEERAHSHIKNERESIDDDDCEDQFEERGLQGDGLIKKQLFYKNQDLKKSGVILNDFKDTKHTQEKDEDCEGRVKEIDGFAAQHDDELKKKHLSQADLKKSVLILNDYEDSKLIQEEDDDCEDNIEVNDGFILRKDDGLKNKNVFHKNQEYLLKPGHDLEDSKLIKKEYYSPTNYKNSKPMDHNYLPTKNNDLRRENNKKYNYKDMKPLNKNKDNNFNRQQIKERGVNNMKKFNKSGENILKLAFEKNGNLKDEDSSIKIQLREYDEEKSHFKPQHPNDNEDDANKKQFEEDECHQEKSEDEEENYNTTQLKGQQDVISNNDGDIYKADGFKSTVEKEYKLRRNKESSDKGNNLNMQLLEDQKDEFSNYNDEQRYHHEGDEIKTQELNLGSNKDANNEELNVNWYDLSSTADDDNFKYRKNEFHKDNDEHDGNTVGISDFERTAANSELKKDNIDVGRNINESTSQTIILNDTNSKHSAGNVPEEYENEDEEGDYTQKVVRIVKADKSIAGHTDNENSSTQSLIRDKLIKNKLNLNNNNEGENNHTNILKHNLHENFRNRPKTNNRDNLHNFDLNHESGNNRNIFDNENNNSGNNQKTSGLNSNNLRKIKNSQQDHFGNPPKTSNLYPEYTNNREKFENSKNANLNNYQEHLERNKDDNLKKNISSNFSHDSVSVKKNASPQTNHELVALTNPEVSAPSENKYNVVNKNPAVVDQKISGSTHKKTKPKNEKYEKGEGKESEAKHATKHEEKGDKGSKGEHKEAKVEHGHHTKEGESGSYKEDGGDEKKHEGSSGYHGEHKAEDGGEKGASYSEDGEHKKGHSTHGSHNVHKKDEYEKREEFYDESDDEGDFDKAGGFFEESDFEKGGSHKESHHDEADHHDLYGSEKHHEKGDHYADGKAHKEYDGHDVHHDHFNLHKKKEDEGKHKKWSYGGKPGRR